MPASFWFERILMKEKWSVRNKGGDYAELGREYGISPVLARILNNRGVSGKEQVAEYLSCDRAGLHDFSSMKQCVSLVDILEKDIRDNKHIRVIGDYDIDGVCATFILLSALKRCGALADHAIPHRVKDGYGLNESLINNAYNDGIDTIITCDNGISAISQVKLAHDLGMKVLITDHHEAPFHMENGYRMEDIPDADAIVDIKLDGSDYPFRELCGASVAMKAAGVLYERFGLQQSDADEFMEFAAFATVGDVMPLVGENRILVKEGLLRLEKTENPGLRALIRAQGIADKKLTPYHVGFVLGPCINATGRLDSAENAFRLLCASSDIEAQKYAFMLKTMNDERKDMTEKALASALELAGESEYGKDMVLVLFLEDCHESIAGIVAGKVRERTGKPTFILTRGENSVKGSGRSIDEYDMHAGMNAVSDLFLQFGGHRLAGGLSISEDRVDEFRKRINENCTLTEDDIAVKVKIDAEMTVDHADMELAEELGMLEPFGMGNSRPLFVTRGARLSNVKVYGRTHNVLKAQIRDAGLVWRNAVYFGDADALLDYSVSHPELCVTYNVSVNDFGGKKRAEIQINNYM